MRNSKFSIAHTYTRNTKHKKIMKITTGSMFGIETSSNRVKIIDC